MLQVSSKLQSLLKMRFYTEVLEKILPLAMWPLAMAGGAGWPNSGDSSEGSGREIVGEGARAHLGLIGVRVGGWETGGGRGRWRGSAAAAAANIPTRMPVLPSNPRLWRLWWRVVVASACTNGSPVAWRGKLTVGGHGGAVAACGAGCAGACVREAAWLP
jgi:hypothetical protein